jgi:hypothetical protein
MSLLIVLQHLCAYNNTGLWSETNNIYSFEMELPPEATEWIQPLIMCREDDSDCLLCATTTFTPNTTECYTPSNCSCSTECPVGYEFNRTCSTDESEPLCNPCPPVANCIYTQAGEQCQDNGCECIAGFEMVSGECVACSGGYFKDSIGIHPCTEWTQIECTEGFFPINGTRFRNSDCLPCPEIPENSTFAINGTACEWICDAGFNETIVQ